MRQKLYLYDVPGRLLANVNYINAPIQGPRRVVGLIFSKSSSKSLQVGGRKQFS